MRDTTIDPREPEIGTFPNNQTENDDSPVVKTGTTTIGVAATDGVVIGTDRRASLGGRFVSSKNVIKVEQIQPRTAMTLVGSVGGAQDFVDSLRAEASLYEARRNESMSVNAIATLAGNFARRGPFMAINPIVGGLDNDGSHIYSIDPAGGVIQDDYTVTGSGQMVAHGKLEGQLGENIDVNVEEATNIVAEAIKAAAERDTGSGNGLAICKITEENLSIDTYPDYEEVEYL